MRSSYAVADELDYTPMDGFQREFFLFRQGEWQDFQKQHPGILQGDLTDPNYFDFISFAQYATIAAGMRSAQLLFTEKVGADGETQTVQRAPELADDALLPGEHARRVGDRIFTYIMETFASVPEALPQVAVKPPLSVIARGVERVMDKFRLNFFCVDAKVAASTGKDGSAVLTVTARAPATLWSQQVLAQRRDAPTNDFEAKAVAAYLRACQVRSHNGRSQMLEQTLVFAWFDHTQNKLLENTFGYLPLSTPKSQMTEILRCSSTTCL
eukprot:TRINITY_DN1391_c0_g1_i2.p1 TRINITY_DN1391_c0_g1~~TRINITY_DN1391_c0_g1_i2.p1  ORF type:complete len:269 (-),score=50.91 TRINITY_DN1391_c0_g1_i2:440-1246(-)